MSLTNFPNGVRSFGIPVLPPLAPATTGKVFFVHSVTGSDDNKGDRPDRPLKTIDKAVGLCTASKGDVVYVMPGHVETVAAANGLDFDVAGISVMGLGRGLDRPQINLTATTATVRVNANSVWLENLRFTGGIDAVAVVLDLNGKTDVVLRNIEYRDVTGQCTVFLKAANNTDRLTIDGLRYLGDAAAGTNAALQFDGCDDLVLRNFYIHGNFANSAIEFITTLSARVYIGDGVVRTTNAADLCVKDTITGSTGLIERLLLSLQDNAANITEAITGATFRLSDTVWVVNADNERAMLINWTASTDA